MADELTALQAEVTRLQRIVETNAVNAAQARTNLESELRHHFDVLELKQSEQRKCFGEKLRKHVDAQGEKTETLRVCLARNLGGRIDVLDTQLETEIERLEERCRVQRNDLATASINARQDLRNNLTTRMVDASVQLRKVIDALADNTDAEIAALSGRVDLNCAGC